MCLVAARDWEGWGRCLARRLDGWDWPSGLAGGADRSVHVQTRWGVDVLKTLSKSCFVAVCSIRYVVVV